MPFEFQKGLGLNFNLQLKDGHWRVTNGEGGLFIDGQFASPGERSGGLFQPNLQLVQLIAGRLGAKRVLDQITGNRLKASPEEISRNVINTMTMLRGRTL